MDDLKRKIHDRWTGASDREHGEWLTAAMDYCDRELRKALTPPSPDEMCRAFAEAVEVTTGDKCTVRFDGDQMIVTFMPREFAVTIGFTPP